MSRRLPRPRTGSLLVELMVVLPIFTTLLVLTIGWIHQSMTLAATMRDRGRHHQHLLLLARQLRDDVHRAAEVQLDDRETLVLALDNATEVTYRFSGRRVVRRWIRQQDTADPAQQGATTGGDAYELADGSRPRWDDSAMPQWVTLVIARPRRGVGGGSPPERASLDQSPPVPDLHVRAAVGRRLSLGVTSPSSEPADAQEPNETSTEAAVSAQGETETPPVSEATGQADSRRVSSVNDAVSRIGR